MELEAANKSDMTVHGMCSLELSVHGLVIHIDTVVLDLNCQAILGMDILGDTTKLPFILDLVDGTLSGVDTKPSNFTVSRRPRNAVGQTENQQRSTRAHRRSRTHATDIRTRIWNNGRQITSARRRRRLENSNSTV